MRLNNIQRLQSPTEYPSGIKIKVIITKAFRFI